MRSGFLCTCLLLASVAASLAAGPAEKLAAPVIRNRTPLPENSFYPLPLTSVKPRGWLRRQLEIQAGGLSGHLDEFWPSLAPDSGWLGGSGESWERGPYFMDGLVPLAFLLDDQKLIAKARKWVTWTLRNQRPDGSIGPEKNKDWWPNMVMLKVLAQYQEATGDASVIPLMQRYVKHQLDNIDSRPLERWAVYRWGDEVLSLVWLYSRTGDENALRLARKLHQQGYDWKRHFLEFQFPGKVSKKESSLKTHVVNNAMALKTSAVWWLVSRDRSDRQAIYRLLQVMDRHHLLPNGVHSGDEHYAGLNPSQGTELCAVVEAMFSLEQLLAILGDPAFGDRLEKIAFNALPATFSADMWAHQYDQQPNQVLCDIHPRDWTTNGPESNLFGLEPNYGCCTANMHQGWPKFAASLWMATPDGGLATVAYAPSQVDAMVKSGVHVRITEETEYPFRDEIRLLIDPETPVKFPLALRVPHWARNAEIRVNGEAAAGVAPGGFHTLLREWRQGDAVEIRFPMALRVTKWFNESVALERGPLVFSLRIGEEWRKIRDKAPAADWEVHPATPWNYGLAIDAAAPERGVEVVEKPVGDFPFSSAGAALEVKAQGRRIPGWGMLNGSAAPPPMSPVSSQEPLETLALIPYGAAKLRITAFPRLAQGQPHDAAP